MEQDHFPPVRNELETSKGPIKLASRLEARFLAHVDKKGIDWVYEPERIGKSRYFVDFHLPKLGVWVEVKGIIQPIDEIQLPQVAKIVKQRDELLFIYQSDNKAFFVTETGFEPITHEELWQQLSLRQNWVAPQRSFIQSSATTNQAKPSKFYFRKKRINRGRRSTYSERFMVKAVFTLAALVIGTIVVIISKRDSLTFGTSNSGIATTYNVPPSTVAVETVVVLRPTEMQVNTPPLTPTLATTIISTKPPLSTARVQTSSTKTSPPTSLEIPTIKVITSSVIVRPNPANRVQKVTELKMGTLVAIVGFAIYESEKTLWWKISANDGAVVGWIINNPKFIEVSNVRFDGDIPLNVDKLES